MEGKPLMVSVEHKTEKGWEVVSDGFCRTFSDTMRAVRNLLEIVEDGYDGRITVELQREISR